MTTAIVKTGREMNLKCPECDYKHWDSRQIGRHRVKIHGLPSKAERERSKNKKSKVGRPKGSFNKPKLTIAKVEVLHHNGIKLEQIAYATGQVETLVRHIAERYDVPPRQFARAVSEYFHLSTVR